MTEEAYPCLENSRTVSSPAGIGCNCLVDIPADSEAVQSGDVVEIILTGQQ